MIERLNAVRALKVDESLGHCESSMYGGVNDQLAADMPSSMAVKPALAIECRRRCGGMFRKRDSM